MKANELRIGNLIKYKESLSHGNEIIHTVTGYTDKRTLSSEDMISTKTGNGSSNAFEPIPLTEELLINLGFENDEGWLTVRKNMGSHTIRLSINLKSNRTLVSSNSGILEATNIQIQHIETAHLAQNTWFALTGEELKIKELA